MIAVTWARVVNSQSTRAQLAQKAIHLIGVQKSVKSADFFYTVILSLFSYIEQKVSYYCGIEF